MGGKCGICYCCSAELYSFSGFLSMQVFIFGLSMKEQLLSFYDHNSVGESHENNLEPLIEETWKIFLNY